jgi:hypothetical protein
VYPHFFDAADLGASLKEVATDIINTGESEVVHRWFHSAKDADFFIWLDGQNNVIKQQITFYGQVVEWNVVEGLKTGLIVEDDSRASVKASDLIRFDTEAQKAPVEQALNLLKHITALNDLERHMLTKNFAHGSTSKNLDPEEFVRRYGSFLKPKRSERTFEEIRASTPKLRRLLGWIRRLLS